MSFKAAVDAGCDCIMAAHIADLLLMPKNFQEAYNAVLEAAKDGRISQERLDASIYRIGEMKLSR